MLNRTTTVLLTLIVCIGFVQHYAFADNLTNWKLVLDHNANCLIDESETRTAIGFWVSGTVPLESLRPLTDSDIQAITQSWIRNEKFSTESCAGFGPAPRPIMTIEAVDQELSPYVENGVPTSPGTLYRCGNGDINAWYELRASEKFNITKLSALWHDPNGLVYETNGFQAARGNTTDLWCGTNCIVWTKRSGNWFTVGRWYVDLKYEDMVLSSMTLDITNECSRATDTPSLEVTDVQITDLVDSAYFSVVYNGLPTALEHEISYGDANSWGNHTRINISDTSSFGQFDLQLLCLRAQETFVRFRVTTNAGSSDWFYTSMTCGRTALRSINELHATIAHTTIKIFDLAGSFIAESSAGGANHGRQLSILSSGNQLARGTYLYVLMQKDHFGRTVRVVVGKVTFSR